jgi:hypothetical protein
VRGDRAFLREAWREEDVPDGIPDAAYDTVLFYSSLAIHNTNEVNVMRFNIHMTMLPPHFMWKAGFRAENSRQAPIYEVRSEDVSEEGKPTPLFQVEIHAPLCRRNENVRYDE